MKTLTASSLALTLAGTAAFAETHMVAYSNVDSVQMNEKRGDLIRSRGITGGEIFTLTAAGAEWSPSTAYSEVGADWNEIGEIEDIVLAKDGQMVGIVAEVDGFLNIGDKHVMTSTPDVNLVAVVAQTNAYVTRLSAGELEALPSVDEGFWG